MGKPSEPSDPPPSYEKAAQEHGVPARPPATARQPPPPLQLPILTYLRSKRVILASASPRRKQLLGQVGLTNLEILPSTKPENLSKSEHTPYEYVSETAKQKCLDVYQAALAAQEEAANDKSMPVPADPDVVIAADTVIVTRDGQILEKPRSEADHIRMLRHLRDSRAHKVLTAVSVLAPKEDATHPGYEHRTHVEETQVFFVQERDGLSNEAIESYVRTREGADKAGGYAVQGTGGLILVEKLDGGFDNVIGLPVRRCLQLAEQVVFQQGLELDDDAE